jgi:hypothetical protein
MFFLISARNKAKLLSEIDRKSRLLRVINYHHIET